MTTNILPLSRGVVIGIGGSGIQTISRVKGFIEASRPDMAARPSVSFLGIDSVGLTQQNPPLTDRNLDPSELMNLTENQFVPSDYVARVGGIGSPISQWWDFDHKIPRGPLTDGCKQSRMLGRLAFYREGQNLTARIQDAMTAAGRITHQNLAAGATDPGVGLLKVFVVCSSCGGTGSSGLLEVLDKIWVAAESLGGGITPQIRVFTYLPGAFADAVGTASANPSFELSNMRANAYGFFRELDYFIESSGELHRSTCNPPATPEPRLGQGDLVHQVFAVDATVKGAGFLTKVTDMYDIVAESIYQFLFTEAGRPMVAENGTNTDVFLQSHDKRHKLGLPGAPGYRRIYCGLGIASIKYPGETLRQHLSARFADWWLREQMLPHPVDLPVQVREHEQTGRLINELGDLHGIVAGMALPPEAMDLVSIAESAPEVLAADGSDETAARVVTAVRNTGPRAERELAEQLRIARDSALAQLDDEVLDEVLETGHGVPFAVEMLKFAERKLDTMRQEIEEARARNQQAVPRLEKEVDELRRRLTALNGRWLVLPGRKENAAKALGDTVRAWGTAILESSRAAGQAEFLTRARARLNLLRRELETAEQRLQRLAQEYYTQWTDDHLIGKDAGPLDTTVLIPADAQPEVEDCALARQAFSDVMGVMNSLDLVQAQRDMTTKWRESAGRAAFGLGSANPDEARTAENALRAVIAELAGKYALQEDLIGRSAGPDETAVRYVLPRSLADAAERDTDKRVLEKALSGLESLAKKPTWQWDLSRMGELDNHPSTTTVIIRPRSLAAKVAAHFKDRNGYKILDSLDEERIIAMCTEWGASVHALGPVTSWQVDYERALKEARSDPWARRPQLDKTWPTKLVPLVPKYYDREHVLDVIWGAELASALLLEHPALADEVFGADPYRESTPVPLRKSDHGNRVAFTLVVMKHNDDDAQWYPSDHADAGSSYRDLVDSVGNNQLYCAQTAAFADDVASKAGRPNVIATLTRLLEQKFEPLRVSQTSDPRERQVIDEICRDLHALRTEYERIALTAI